MHRSHRRFPALAAVASAAVAPAVVALALLWGCAPGPTDDGDTAGDDTGAAEEPGGSFGYPPETVPEEVAEPLLELRYEGGLIKNPDPTPFVRVYPGGRVLIHYPAYMKKAGDYELQLDEQELEELLSSFADREVLTTESDELAAMAAAARADDQLADVADDHGVRTVVEIRADSFTEAGATEPTLMEIDRTLVAEDLPSLEALAATRDPGLRRLERFTRGVRRLESLAERTDLEPVTPSEAGEGRNR